MDLIRKDFDEKLCLMPDINLDFKAAIRRGRNYPLFLRNLHAQLIKVPKLQRETVRRVVYDFTEYHMRAFQKYADERIMSDLEKSRLKKVEDDRATADKVVDRITKTGVIDAEDIEEFPEI